MPRILTTVALLLALGACVTPAAQKPSTTATAPPAPATVEAAPTAPQPEPEPVIEPVIDEETQAIIETSIAILAPPEETASEETASEGPVVEPPMVEAALEPEIDDDPDQLMGLAGDELAKLLGEPGFRREDADAQIWQYGGGDCALDIYLYRGGETLPHRVTYYEFRGGAAGRPCLRSLLLAEAG